MFWQASCLVAVALAVGCGCKSTSADEKGKASAAAADSAPAPVGAAGPADAGPQVYELSGTANAARVSRLSAKGAGILRTIKVREGERVKQGQVLCTLDTTDVGIRSQSAAVAHSQALEGLKNAQDDLRRARMLFDAGALPAQTIEKAELAVRVAELQVQGAKVGMRMTSQAMADATLVAPFNGVITKVMAEEGQMITQMPPVIIFVLADTDTLEVRVPVPERRLKFIQPDMRVVVHLDAMDADIDAKVDRIAEVIDPATRSTEAIIRVDNTKRRLPAGLYARVRFPSLPADLSSDAPAPAVDGGVAPNRDGGR